MSINAGEVKATYTGDAAGLVAASEKARKALADTGTEAKATAAKLKAADEQSRALASANKAAADAADAHAVKLGRVREGLEKARGTMGALGQVAGVATSQFGALGGAMQGVLGSFMTNGALGAGLALVAGGIALAADKFDVFGEKAKKAAEDSAKHLAGLRGEVDALVDALNSASGAKLEFEVESLDRSLDEKRKALEAAIPAGAGAQFQAYQNSPSYRDDGQVVGAYAAARTLALEIEQIEAKRHYTANAIAKLEIDTAEEKLKREIEAQKRAGTAADKLAEKLEALGPAWAGGGIAHGMGLNELYGNLAAGAGGVTSYPTMDAPMTTAEIEAMNADFLGDVGTGPVLSINHDDVAKAGRDFSMVAAEGIGSGMLSGGITGAAAALGAAAGIPFAGEIVSGIMQGVEMMVQAFADFGEMLLRVPRSILSGTSLGGPSSALAGDMGTTAMGAFAGASAGAALGMLGGPISPVTSTIGAVAGGAIGGGAMGGASIGNFVMALSQATPEFEKFMSVFSSAADTLIAPLGEIWKALSPMAGAFLQLADALAPVLGMSSMTAGLEAVMPYMINAMKSLAIGSLWVASRFVDLEKGMVYFLVGTLQMSAEAAEKHLKELDAYSDDLSTSMDKIDKITVDTAKGKFVTELERLAGSAGQSARALEQFSEGTENLPAGYRTAGAEYRASDARAPTTNNNVLQVQSLTINMQGAESGGRLQDLVSDIKRRAWSASTFASLGRLSIADARN